MTNSKKALASPDGPYRPCMKEEIWFIAPNGVRISGAVQDGGRDDWPVIWDDGNSASSFEDYIDSAGPDGAGWETVSVEGEHGDILYGDDTGKEWLGRHLIREGAEPLSEEAIALARRDLGAALAAEAMAKALEAIRSSAPPDFEPKCKKSPYHEMILSAETLALATTEAARQFKAHWTRMLEHERAAGRGVFVEAPDGGEAAHV
jgi:predicted dehydrogenase